MPSNDADYGRDYYKRNREHILEMSRTKIANREKTEKMLQYQREYFTKNIEAVKATRKKWREEHKEETAEKQRKAYSEQVLEEVGRIVVPTAKRLDATGIERRTQKRLATIGDTMHRRHIIARRLEMNELRAEQFKKILSGENICPTNNELEEAEIEDN